jgi:hypothetical protein
MQKSAMCANDDQTFWPLTRKWSPLSSILVRAEARSLPAPLAVGVLEAPRPAPPRLVGQVVGDEAPDLRAKLGFVRGIAQIHETILNRTGRCACSAQPPSPR